MYLLSWILSLCWHLVPGLWLREGEPILMDFCSTVFFFCINHCFGRWNCGDELRVAWLYASWNRHSDFWKLDLTCSFYAPYLRVDLWLVRWIIVWQYSIDLGAPFSPSIPNTQSLLGCICGQPSLALASCWNEYTLLARKVIDWCLWNQVVDTTACGALGHIQ